jgi:hypothetical protein
MAHNAPTPPPVTTPDVEMEDAPPTTLLPYVALWDEQLPKYQEQLVASSSQFHDMVWKLVAWRPLGPVDS